MCQLSTDKCFEASQRKSIGACFEPSYNFAGLYRDDESQNFSPPSGFAKNYKKVE